MLRQAETSRGKAMKVHAWHCPCSEAGSSPGATRFGLLLSRLESDKEEDGETYTVPETG